MNEENFGHGAIPDSVDNRDFQFNQLGLALPPYDWSKEYDIESIIGFKLPIKNQNGSGSCGGQAWAYYGEVLDCMTDKVFTEKSAKFIYAQTFVPPSGGSNGRDNCDIAVKQGFADEAICSSYLNGQPAPESFYEQVGDITDVIRANAKIDRALSYANVNPDIDSVAQAIANCGGVVLGVNGENNGSWSGVFPTPPSAIVWRHWIFACKIKMINGRKYIGFPNSWGVGVGQLGWQWLGEEYFTTKNVFQVWTLVFNNQLPTPPVIPPFQFTKTLHAGMTDSDVKKLQQFLNTHGFPLALSGAGSAGNETNFFGSLSLKAVKLFQTANHLTPDGIVGVLFIACINKLM